MSRRTNTGMSLLEVVIVIVGLALLVAFFLVGNTRERDYARGATCASNLRHLHKAITMYHEDFEISPTRAGMNEDPRTEGDAQEALNLLYKQYIDDVRVFSCPSNRLPQTLLDSISPSTATGWTELSFKESPPGAKTGRSTSYGYSPGHDLSNALVIIMADHKGSGPNGFSDNHGADSGMTTLSAGGVVVFQKTIGNKLGKDDDNNPIYDPDIYSDNEVQLGEFYALDSFCR